MIQTTLKIDYSKPNEQKKEGTILLEASYTMTLYGVVYNIEHFAIINNETGAKVSVTSTTRNLTIEQYNQFSGAVDVAIQNFDTSEMTAFQIEQLRVKLGLFIYVTQFDVMDDGVHVAYDLLPNQWKLSK